MDDYLYELRMDGQPCFRTGRLADIRDYIRAARNGRHWAARFEVCIPHLGKTFAA